VAQQVVTTSHWFPCGEDFAPLNRESSSAGSRSHRRPW
jgi:hypothetical protein